MTVVESLAPAEARGRYTGVWASTMGISALIAPLVSSTALDLGGTAFMWTTSTAPAAAAALGLIALQRHVDNPPAAVPEPANRDLVPASA